MFKTRTFWAIVLGVMTSVLIFEARINFSDNPLFIRAANTLSAPGAHVVTALDSRAGSLAGWARLWQATSIASNFLIYAFFWYACIWTIGYLRARQYPYDRQNTLLSH